MNYIKESFSNKKLGFWIAFGSAVAMLISSIIFIITTANNDIFSPLTLIFALIGAALRKYGAEPRRIDNLFHLPPCLLVLKSISDFL